jgi:RNA polymerase sigma factor (sigma-70 family)
MVALAPRTTEPGDELLVAATLAGDDHAFAELYRRHAPAVAAAIRDRERDPERVADAVQESFARALARLDALREPTRFRAWVLAIGRNIGTDHQRSAGQVRLESIAGDSDDRAEPTDPAAGPDELASLGELATLVRGCVAGLSPRDATAVGMVTWLGLGPAEVAAGLGISHGAAKVLLHRARRRLRDRVVLEVAAARRRGGCPELAAVQATDDEVAALRHVRTCGHCEGSTRHALGIGAAGDDPAAGV